MPTQGHKIYWIRASYCPLISVNNICCYTDGSKTDHGVGGGYVIKDPHDENTTEHHFKMKDHCTVFQAEIAAIMHAADRLTHHNNKLITFWSDSLSALQALSNRIHRNKSVTDCHKSLTLLAQNNTVQVRWIKAHIGHWGNEKADQLAKAGTKDGNPVTSLVPISFIKHLINTKVTNLSHDRWITNKHAHTDMIIGNHQKKVFHTLNDNMGNRIRYRTAISIITGHIGLNKHLHRITRADTPNCPYCTDTEETVAHFIGQCPAFMRIRGNTLGTYYDSINDIMDNNSMDALISYTLQTKRLQRTEEETDNTGVT